MTNIGLKRKIIAGGIIALILGCTACSSNENTVEPSVPFNVAGMPQTTGENSQQPQADLNNSENSETPQNQEILQEPENPSFAWYSENSNLHGHVVEFSEDGFTLSAGEQYEEDGGSVYAEAVPGTEDQDSLITISYSEDTIFEVITADLYSSTIFSRETVDKETVKKESNVFVFGTCQDTRNWTADRVVIIRWSR